MMRFNKPSWPDLRALPGLPLHLVTLPPPHNAHRRCCSAFSHGRRYINITMVQAAPQEAQGSAEIRGECCRHVKTQQGQQEPRATGTHSSCSHARGCQNASDWKYRPIHPAKLSGPASQRGIFISGVSPLVAAGRDLGSFLPVT